MIRLALILLMSCSFSTQGVGEGNDGATCASAERCNGEDDDCDGEIDEGFDIGQPCDGSDDDLCPEGKVTCDGCSDDTDDAVEDCDELDNDCDGEIDEGLGTGSPCDGPDADFCEEGLTTCDGCSDESGDNPELCDGLDNDCDPLTADDEDESTLGSLCDGSDGDLCLEGTLVCLGALGLGCTDATPTIPDLCDDLDNDCNPSTPDGFAEVDFGTPCDGLGDEDLCAEGTLACNGSSLYCNDPNDLTLDFCDGVDNDCDSSTPDGAANVVVGFPCDGLGDADLCEEGLWSCGGVAGLVCGDPGEPDQDLCDGIDNDCNPDTPDGTDESFVGSDCDGADVDLCTEGTIICDGGGLLCSDPNDYDPDLCDAVDNDCDPLTPNGSGDPLFGEPCDGAGDTDFCTEGVWGCVGTGPLSCSDPVDDDEIEACDGIDNNCDGAIDEGLSGTWTKTMVDPSVTVSHGTSTALGGDGSVHISYYNDATADLRYVGRSSAGVWGAPTLVDGASDSAGRYSSITVGDSGDVHVSYHEFLFSAGDLRYARLSDGAWALYDFGGPAVEGTYTSIGLNSGGLVHISHRVGQFNVEHVFGSLGGPWTFETVQSGAGEVRDTALAIDSQDRVHIAFEYDPPGGSLGYRAVWYAMRSTAGTWIKELAATAASCCLGAVDIAVDTADRPHITYRVQTVDFALYHVARGSSWSAPSLVDSSFWGFGDPSMAIDPSDRIHIAYTDLDYEHLLYAYRDLFAAGWTIETVDSAETSDPSLAVSPLGGAHIGYYLLMDNALNHAYRCP